MEAVDAEMETVDAQLEAVDAQVETVNALMGAKDTAVEPEFAHLETIKSCLDGVIESGFQVKG